MSPVRIVTDATVQFSKPVFPGRQYVDIIPLPSVMGDEPNSQPQEWTVQQLPASINDGNRPRLAVPSSADLHEYFLEISRHSIEIIAILHSSNLSPLYRNAKEAADELRGRVSITLIDSLSTSVGLGYLVQSAASAVQDKPNVSEIEGLMRGLLPHIYSVFCLPGLTYLHSSGYLGLAQAVVGEMLGLLPIFSFEEGFLTPLEKVRNQRHLLDFFQEFIDEFSELKQISIIQSLPSLNHDIRILREHASQNFPNTPFSEHPINLPLATLFGPRSIGVFAIEGLDF